MSIGEYLNENTEQLLKTIWLRIRQLYAIIKYFIFMFLKEIYK